MMHMFEYFERHRLDSLISRFLVRFQPRRTNNACLIFLLLYEFTGLHILFCGHFYAYRRVLVTSDGHPTVLVFLDTAK